jgi:8-oxo-dGTP pyrophosphatase MutT (NUDIX family)
LVEDCCVGIEVGFRHYIEMIPKSLMVEGRFVRGDLVVAVVDLVGFQIAVIFVVDLMIRFVEVMVR